MKPDQIVERLVPDPTNIPDVRVLAGFLGKTNRKNHWRLYLTTNLTNYVEFDQDDVVHSEQLEGDEYPLGGTVIWINRDANLQHMQLTSREAQADFLQGRMRAGVRRRNPAIGGQLTAAAVPFTPSFHFFSICDELAAPSFLSGGDVFCGGSFQCNPSFQAECP